MLGIKDTESRQTVKLTLYNRTEILRVRYTDVLVVKTKPPTYLFVHLSISKSQRQKPDQCALTCGAPAQICLKISASLPVQATLPSVPASPSGAPAALSAPPVKGVLVPVIKTRKRFFKRKYKNTKYYNQVLVYITFILKIFFDFPS